MYIYICIHMYLYIIHTYIHMYIYILGTGHRVSRARGTGSVGDSVGERGYTCGLVTHKRTQETLYEPSVGAYARMRVSWSHTRTHQQAQRASLVKEVRALWTELGMEEEWAMGKTASGEEEDSFDDVIKAGTEEDIKVRVSSCSGGGGVRGTHLLHA